MRRSHSSAASIGTLAVALAGGCSSGGGDSGFGTFSDGIMPSSAVRVRSLTLGFDENSQLERLEVSSPGEVAFRADDGDSIVDQGTVIALASADGADRAIFADPRDMGFDYQTYGAWATGLGTGEGSAGFAASFGGVEAPFPFPRRGEATYSGGAAGVFADRDGRFFLTSAEFSATAKFAEFMVEMTTSATEARDLGTGARSAMPQLDITASLEWVDGNSLVAHDILTQSGMTGDANARLYGPNAEEIGGTFRLSGGGASYRGAFGGVE